MALDSLYKENCVPITVTEKKAVLSELDLLAEGKTSEVSFREVLAHVLAKECMRLPTSFTVPTAPQEPPVPIWVWNCTQHADIRKVPRVLNKIAYGNLLVFSVPLARVEKLSCTANACEEPNLS